MVRFRLIPRLLVLPFAAALQGCGVLGGGTVETPQQIQARQQRDETIRREVEARMAAEPSIGAGRLRAVVNAGDVQLHGAVAGFGALQCAMANAELVAGVRLVIDYMVLQPGPRRVTCLAPRNFSAPAAP
jgi:osmotically-inducible protein OsmY